jgi:uncharacterized protein (DUF885 family)
MGLIESLGNLGMNPYQYFGMLGKNAQAVRLLLTAQINSGWTREQAIQFSMANEAESEAQ